MHQTLPQQEIRTSAPAARPAGMPLFADVRPSDVGSRVRTIPRPPDFRAAWHAMKRYVRYAGNILQYAKLKAQPHDFIEPLPRERWTETACDPDVASIKLAGARPT